MRGSCLSFNRTKGYGFLLPNGNDLTMPDVFCHFSEIKPSLHWRRKFLLPGMTLEFDVQFEPEDLDEGRPRAVNVRVVAPVVIARQGGDRAVAR
jgi:cold shock CspA family protein